MMKFFQLQYFCAVCDWKCVTKAAENSHVSQPSISIALKDLENELGVSLFVRNRNKLLLTSEGELFYRHAKKILSDLDKAVTEVQRTAQNEKNIIIGIPPILASFTFYKLLRVKETIENSNNRITLQLIEVEAPCIAKMLENREIDLAIIGLTGDSYFETCGCEILWKTSLIFCAHKSHPLSKKELISIDDIQNEPLIVDYKKEELTNNLVTEWFSKFGRSPNFKYSFSQYSTMINLLCNNVGVTLIRSDLCPENSELVYINLEDTIRFDAGVVWNSSQPLSSSHSKVISILKKSFS